MRRLILPIAAISLAACGQTPQAPQSDPATENDAFNKRAEEVAQAWDKVDHGDEWTSGQVLLDEVTKLSDGADLDEAQQAGFDNGWYELDAELPEEADDTVVFADGEETAKPRDAQTAYDELATGGAPPKDCPSEPADAETEDDGSVSKEAVCGVLTVTEVTAGTDQRWTSRGMAEFPVWELTLEGVEAPMTTVAVETQQPAAMPPIATPEFEVPKDMKAASSVVKMTESELTFTLTVGACDSDFQPLIHQTDAAVIVAGTVVTDDTEVCTEQAIYEPVTAPLSDPIGQRVILDGVSGQPLGFTVDDAMTPA